MFASIPRSVVFASFPVNGVPTACLATARPAMMYWSRNEGDTFNGQSWMVGIHKLYDTTVLYDIQTSVLPVADSEPKQITQQIIWECFQEHQAGHRDQG